jgi:hypothetical protein
MSDFSLELIHEYDGLTRVESALSAKIEITLENTRVQQEMEEAEEVDTSEYT